MTSTPAIELHDLTKDFVVGVRGVRLRAVSNLNLVIRRGEIFGLLGPNGSGKSTTIKLILGLLKPTSGRCAIFGVGAGRPEARVRMGYLPESPDFYRHLSGRELIRFYASLCCVSSDTLTLRVEAALNRVGLVGAADRRIATYSKGMLQRLGLAQAIVHDPELLILDEPTAGVDANACVAVTKLLREFRREGKTVVITSHVPGELHELCDRIAVLDRGQLISIAPEANSPDPRVAPSLQIDGLRIEERAELDDWLSSRGHLYSKIIPARLRCAQSALNTGGEATDQSCGLYGGGHPVVASRD